MCDDIEWTWTTQQANAVRDIKSAIISAPVLRFFDLSKVAIIQCDASSMRLGVVLLQEGQPCAFASRALTDAETRYAQMGKTYCDRLRRQQILSAAISARYKRPSRSRSRRRLHVYSACSSALQNLTWI
jgi:hypothetical protein